MTQVFTNEDDFNSINHQPTIKYHAVQIKSDDILTTEEIANIPIQMVYMWTRSGAWKQKDFIKWLNAVKEIATEEGNEFEDDYDELDHSQTMV